MPTACSAAALMKLHELPSRAGDRALVVVVESPHGTGVKMKWDPEAAVMTYGRSLPLGMTYPFEFGFVPSTQAADGDPLDAIVLADGPTGPGVVVHARPIAILRATQKAEGGRRIRNDRLVCVATGDRRRAEVTQLGTRERQEIEAFFLATTELEGKEVAFDGWGNAAEAWAEVERSAAGADDGQIG